jgi:glycosyltransferase involved in cell wall biosynthesis
VRVVVLSSESQLNSSYRAMQPAQALASAGHQVVVKATEERHVREEALRGFDVVYVYRWFERSLQAIVQRLRGAGAAIVWDNDDDLTANQETAKSARAARALHVQRTAGEMHAMLRLADLVTTPSPHLADRYREHGAADVRVVENFVASEFASAEPRPRVPGVTIGWTAAGEHARDLEQLGLRETLRRLLDAHADVHVASVGVDLGLERERYRRHDYVPFRDLPALVAGFDVGIAPIADLPFNRARSNIKLKEYGVLGIPWLASPIGPYAGLGEREGGRLVPDDGWYEALERLVERGRERRKLGKRAQRWARRQTVEHNAGRWIEAFEAARERRARVAA